MKYMDDNKIAENEFSCEHAWQIAKRISTIAKNKSRKEIIVNLPTKNS